jgi:hypothetical protein
MSLCVGKLLDASASRPSSSMADPDSRPLGHSIAPSLNARSETNSDNAILETSTRTFFKNAQFLVRFTFTYRFIFLPCIFRVFPGYILDIELMIACGDTGGWCRHKVETAVCQRLALRNPTFWHKHSRSYTYVIFFSVSPSLERLELYLGLHGVSAACAFAFPPG